MSRTSDEGPPTAVGRLSRALDLTGRRLRIVQLALLCLAWIVTLVATLLTIQSGLWERIRDGFVERKLAPEVTETVDVVAVTPADVIGLQFKLSALVGLLVVAPFAAYVVRGRLGRRREGTDEPLSGASVVAWSALASGSVVLGVVAVHAVVIAPLLSTVATSLRLQGLVASTSILEVFYLVAALGTSLGLAVAIPLLTAELTDSGVVRPETVLGDVLRVGVVLAAFGFHFWPTTLFVQTLWLAPLLASLALSVGVCRAVASGGGSRPVP